MLTEKEKLFLKYWEANRQRQKKTSYQLLVGLPVNLVLFVGLPVGLAYIAEMIYSTHSVIYTRAATMINSKSSPALLIVALLIIAIFVTIFSKKNQWDQREQKYLELMSKKNQLAGAGA